MKRRSKRADAGFSLIELLIVMAIIAVLIGVLLPALHESRRVVRAHACMSNMRQLGTAYSTYAVDASDRIASFTWRAGVDYGFGGIAGNANDAAAHQAVDIIRTLAERDDIQPIHGWIPHIFYGHLVLNSYLQQRLPEKAVICPEDRPRNLWQEAALNAAVDHGAAYFALVERPAGQDNSSQRWPYSSSYQLVPAGFSPDKQVNTPRGPIPTVAQDAMGHRYYQVGNQWTILGDRRLTEVTFPAQKVAMFDQHTRHMPRRNTFYAYSICSEPVLAFDTSVREMRTEEVNLGFYPNTPHSPGPTHVMYYPELSWEPPKLEDGGERKITEGRYQWCREGLRGVDFAGGEVTSVDPGG